MSRVTLLANWLLRLPLLWGGLFTLAFYAFLRAGWIESALLTQYFDSHPIERVTTLLFFVGAAALTMRLVGLLGQFPALRADPFGSAPAEGVPWSEAPQLLAKLDRLAEPLQRTYIVRRLREALQYVEEVGSADNLEDQLTRLEEADRHRLSSGFALPRLVRSTLPIVGMLGTVIGITLAIGQLSPDQLEQSLGVVMSSLSVAFDTTAQAMSLMLVLWFATFGVERVEQRLLDRVDEAAAKLLVFRFQQYGANTDPGVASIRRMGEQVVEAVERLTTTQSEAWQSVIEASHDRWNKAAATTGELMTESIANGVREGVAEHARLLNEGVEQHLNNLADAERLQLGRVVDGADEVLGNLREGLERMAELLVEALHKHGETLTSAEEELASENRRHLSEVEAALGESMVVAADRQEKLIRQSESLLLDLRETIGSTADATVKHHEQLVKQGEVLLRVVESTGQVQQLEETLNRNLASLAGSHNFEETLVSLSAAIQLLTARLGREAASNSPGKAA